MPLNELDLNKLSRLTSQQVDHVTCIECCKYYIVPTTATCGHTLCHTCWRGRRTCPSCGSAIDRKALKLNLPLQDLTEHVHTLGEEFEKLFHVKLDEFLLDTPSEKKHSEDPSKNVTDWLASSENQFSVPQTNSQQSAHNHPDPLKSNKQINNETSKYVFTNKTVHVGISQDDWDKIEVLPDNKDVCNNEKENIIEPMEIEPFTAIEFTIDNPRRSSRKKDVKGIPISESDNYSKTKGSLKNSSIESDSKIVKQKHNWANVKRMKKEFSKLNKKNRNKLNVSIEMCKKSQNSVNKNIPIQDMNVTDNEILNIDHNTPHDNCKETESLHFQNKILVNDIPSSDVIKTMIEKDVGNKTEVNSIHVAENKIISNKNIPSNDDLPAAISKKVTPVAFIMKGALQSSSFQQNYNNNESCVSNASDCITVNDEDLNTDDIEITIKIGNTLTNICIKKKEKDVQFKINTDREVQTCLEKCEINKKNNASCSPIQNIDSNQNIEINIPTPNQQISQNIAEKCSNSEKLATTSISNKKNTGSADTATALYEITDSVEKQLSKVMEKLDTQKTAENSLKIDRRKPNPVLSNDVLERECLNDLDLFDNDSVKEAPIQSLKSSKYTPSEILLSTVKSNKGKKKIDKRSRDVDENNLPAHKRFKTFNEKEADIHTLITNQKINSDQDSELTNYEAIMGQVFANIDADMEDLKNETKQVANSQADKKDRNKKLTQFTAKITPNLCESIHGLSENVFSLMEKENDITCSTQKENQSQSFGQKNNDNPPVTNCDALSYNDLIPNNVEFTVNELSTPVQENDDSDKSIVEETPQKSSSFLKLKQNSDSTRNTENIIKKVMQLKRNEKNEEPITAKRQPTETPDIMSVTDLSDVTENTTKLSRNMTVIEAGKPKQTLETPLTIHKFVDQIKHKSTPMARKSLNFDKENTEKSDADPDKTLCPSSFLVAKTTQEREFMSKAFEQTPNSGVGNALSVKNHKTKNKYYIAGSCLTSFELSNVKLLCSQKGWAYIDKYTNELTHLVVGVDEERKSQRSVKYMCALAASKWIVSYEWVEKCLQLKKVIDEEPHEALDSTGEPGPKRSRIAKQKLFQGIIFYCMPPFSVLDVNALKGMLEAAGGRVVNEAKGVQVTGSAPALLLAEPEHTQEDRFMYLAMELSIVPVNYEWVLNCLGSYTLSSVQELLLCPASLLPPATSQWPPELMAREYD